MADQTSGRDVSVHVLRNRLLAAALVACLMVVLTTAGILSLAYYTRAKETEDARLIHEGELIVRSIDEYIKMTQAVASQISSRTRARRLLEMRIAKDIGEADFRQETEMTLTDALGGRAAVHGILRLDNSGELIAATGGHDAPRRAWPVGHAYVDRTLVGEPYVDKTHRPFETFLVVSSPIRSVKRGRIGTDIVVFSLRPLFEMLQQALWQTDETLYIAFDTQKWAIKIQPDAIEIAPAEICGWIEANRVGTQSVVWEQDEHLLSLAAVNEIDWFAMIQVGIKKIYATAMGDMLRVASIALITGILVAAVFSWFLRPLATGIFMRADELEREVARQTEQLRKSEQRLRDFSEAASDWFWETDTEHRLQMLSDRFGRLVGIEDPASVIGRARWELADSNLENPMWARHRDMMEAHDPIVGFEYEIKGSDQTMKTFRIDGKPIFGEDGRFIGYRGTGRDVSDLLREKSEHERTERLFLEAIASLPMAFALFDPDDGLLLWNRRYATLVAKGVPLVVGMKFEDVLRHAMDKGRISHAEGRMDEWVEARMNYHRSPQGTFSVRLDDLFIEIQEHRTKGGGTILVVQDVTAAKRAEEQIVQQRDLLETIIETIPLAVFWKDRNGVYQGCNRHFVIQRDLRDKDQVVGKTIRDFAYLNDDAEKVAAEDEAVIRGELEQVGVEQTRRQADGSTRIHLSSKMPIRSRNGEIRGLVGAFLDITEQKGTEALLHKSQKLASLGNMAAGMAHEINNLLLPIVGLTRMTVRRMDEATPERARLEKVVDAAQRAATIIAQVMEFGRQDAGVMEPIDPRDVVERALETMRPALPADIRLDRRLRRGLGRVLANADGLHMAIVNLMSNAIDSFGGHPGRIRIRLDRVDVDAKQAIPTPGSASGPHVRLRIEDTGCGMDAETLERALDPFFTTKDVGQGTGLGLSVAHGIVERHGGAMHIDSIVGQGTRIEIYLPLTAEQTRHPALREGTNEQSFGIIADMERRYGTRIGN